MKALYSILFLILGVHLHGQKPYVSLSSDVKSIQAGDQITFTVKSTISGEISIDYPKEFIAGNGTMSGMEQEMDYNSGEVTTIYHFSQNGSFKTNGTYTFYAYVNNRRKIYKSNALTIKVEKLVSSSNNSDEEISKRNLKQPVFGFIQRSKTKIYEGEPLILQAKICSKLNVNMMDEYAPFEVEGGAEMKDIEKTQRLLMSKESIKGQTYLTFNYGKQVVFPSNIGKLKINPFEMTLQYDNGSIFSERISFVSNSSIVEVIPLPDGAPKDFIGGVGHFELTSELSKKYGKIGDVTELKITISGYGNLHTVAKPKLNLPKHLSIYGDPEVTELINFSSKGAEGSVSYTFHLRMEQEGKTNLPSISISYFNPEKKKYIQVKEPAISLEILPTHQTITAPIETQVKTPEKEVESVPLFSSNSTQNNGIFYHSVYFWPSVFSPFLLAFLGGIYFNSSKQKDREKTISNQNKDTILRKIALIEQLAINQTLNTQQRAQELENILKSLAQEDKCSVTTFCTKLELYDLLKNQGASEDQLIELKQLFVACEEIKFSYDDETAKFNQLCSLAQSLLKELA
jgi:hypothetical protein